MTPAHRDYSSTPLPRKLGVEPGMRVALIGAPARFADHFEDAVVRTRLSGSFGVVVAFATSGTALARRIDALVAALEPRGGLWLAWPKRASGGPTDLDERTVRETGLATGLVDNKVCAIDATWSALRFVRRRDPR